MSGSRGGAVTRRTPAAGRPRLLRAAVLGGSSLVLAGSAHTWGGGQLPAPAVLVVTGVMLGLVATAATARRCRFPLLVGLVGLEQILLHLWFTAAGQAAAGCSMPAGAGSAHLGHTMVGKGCLPTLISAGGETGHSYPMWVAHAAAVALTAWLLARGEAWWWRTVDRVVRAAGRPLSSLAEAAPLDLPAAPTTFSGPQIRSTAAPRAPPVLIAS